MLSRIAESLFWIGRLVERAEDVARMLDVSVHLLLEESSGSEDAAFRALMSVVGLPDDLDEDFEPARVLDRLAYDHNSPVWSSLEGARENARTVREVIPSEVWLCLNRTYNELQAQRARARRSSPTTFLQLRQGALCADVRSGGRHHEP